MKFTKTSILVSTIFLTLGVAISWQDYYQLATARESQSKLAVKLAGVGIRFDLSQPGEKVGIAKRQREKKEKNHHESSSGLIALIREITADVKSSGKLDPTTSAKLRSFETRLKSLDSAQWRAFLAEIEADKVFEKCGNTNAVFSSMIMMMGVYFRDSDQPQTLLALATQFPALFKDKDRSLELMGSNLALWTKKDLTSAVAWLRGNHAVFPGLATNYSIAREMFPTVAMKDPALAFQLMDDLGIKNGIDQTDTVFHLASFSETAENRTAILAALHHYVSVMSEGEERDVILNCGITGLAKSAMAQGFETGTEWISHAGITPNQFAYLFEGVAIDGRFDGGSQWVDWLIPHLPQDKVAEKVGKLVTFWVKEDYKSAADWISHNADGPVKNAAIHAFSYEVAAYEPAVAVQWAMTLPAGENRQQALVGIYENWLKSDVAGKRGFGNQHGFE